MTGSVRFYKPKTEKTELKKKLEKTEPKRKNTEPNRKIEPNRFEPVFVLKNRTELKPIGLNRF